MFKKILVGLDVYVEAQHAFDDALSISEATNASLTLLHVFSLDETYNFCQSLLYESLEHPTNNLLAQSESDPLWQCIISRSIGHEVDQPKVLLSCLAEAEKAGIQANVLPRRGQPGRVLCEVARNEQADLIAVGHCDQKHWKNRVKRGERRLGSVSHYVIHHAPCSVLIAHRHIEDHVAIGALAGLRQIVVPVDDSDTSKVVVKEALDLAKAVGASVTLLHVRSSLQDNSLLDILESYANQATALDIPITIKQLDVKDHQSIGQMICELAEDQRFDLIFMGRRRLSGLQEVVLGSVSHYVVNHASCAVLVVHPVQRKSDS